MKETLKIKKEYISTFVSVVLLNFVYVLPIIIANRYFNDDLARSLYGMTGWNGDGRPLMQLLLQFLGGGSSKAVDVAPLPLILSVFLISYVLTVYAKENLDFIKPGVGLTLALLLFSLNPFMIYSFSYKYDCIGMVLSMCILIVLFVVPPNIKWWISLIVSVIVGIVVMMLYQPSIGLSVGLCLMGVFLFFIGKKDILKLHRDIVSLGGVAVGAIIYKVLISGFFIVEEAGDWRYDAAKTVSFGASAIKQILINLYNMLLYVYRYYKNNMSLIYQILILVIAVAAHIYTVYSLRKSIIKMLGVLVMPIVMLVGILAPLTLLNEVNVKGRMFFTFGIVLLFFGIEIVLATENKKWLGITAIIIMALYSYSFMYMYGNASASQKEYEEYLANSIAKDIDELTSDYEDNTVTITIVGDTPRAKETSMLMETYPALEEMVPTYITNSWWLGGSYLSRFVSKNMQYVEQFEGTRDMVRSNSVYSVYKAEDRIIVEYN